LIYETDPLSTNTFNYEYYPLGNRIVSEDAIDGLNRYTYCMNNPVNMSDPDGNWPEWITNAANKVREFVNDGYEAAKSFVSEAVKGIADAVFGQTIVDKLNDTKISKTHIPSLGPAAELKTVTLRPVVKAFKGASKLAGPVAVGSYGYDVYQDFGKYTGKNRAKAITLTSAGAGLAIGVGFIATGLGAPVGVAIVAGAGTGVLAQYAGGWAKRRWIGY